MCEKALVTCLPKIKHVMDKYKAFINDVETIMLNGESLMSISSTDIIQLKLNYFYKVIDGTPLTKEDFDEKLRAKLINIKKT